MQEKQVAVKKEVVQYSLKYFFAKEKAGHMFAFDNVEAFQLQNACVLFCCIDEQD